MSEEFNEFLNKNKNEEDLRKELDQQVKEDNLNLLNNFYMTVREWLNGVDVEIVEEEYFNSGTNELILKFNENQEIVIRPYTVHPHSLVQVTMSIEKNSRIEITKLFYEPNNWYIDKSDINKFAPDEVLTRDNFLNLLKEKINN